MKHYLCSLLLFTVISLNAQITFQKGYFVNNANQKTECFIRNIDWKNNPTEFEYKLSNDDKESQMATISSVTEFGIENESKYKRFDINIEKSGDNLANISNEKNPVYQKQTSFLKVLIEGSASLYQYNEGTLYKYFYQTKTTPITQLIYIKYNSADRNSDNLNSYATSIKTNNLFRQQLYNDVKCESMTDNEFESISYNRDGLVKHFTKFNACKGDVDTNYKAKNEKSIFNLKVTVGVSTASLSVRDPHTYYNLSMDTDSKIVYNFGAEFEYILPFNKNKLSFFVNPTYQKFNTTKTYTNSDGFTPPHDLEHKAVVDYTSIEIPIGFRYYMFLNKNSKLFIDLIYSLNYAPGSSIKFDDDDAKVYNISPSSNFGLGFGYSYKNKFSVELRDLFTREALGGYLEWSSNYSTLGIQLAYKVF